MSLDALIASAETAAQGRWPLTGGAVTITLGERHAHRRWRAIWTTIARETPMADAYAATREDAVQALIDLATTGSYTRAYRLAEAQAREDEALAAYEAARAERETIEAEPLTTR